MLAWVKWWEVEKQCNLTLPVDFDALWQKDPHIEYASMVRMEMPCHKISRMFLSNTASPNHVGIKPIIVPNSLISDLSSLLYA